MALFFPRVLRQLKRQHYEQRRCNGQWFLAFRERKPGDQIASVAIPSAARSLLLPPEDRFYADPFIVKHNGANFLFFEDCDFGLGKGAISYVSLDGCGRYSTIRTALETDYHLSYPMIFAWRNNWYMIPETKANRTIELYRATRFPDQWRLEEILFKDVSAVDTTVMEHGGKWWLFTNMSSFGASVMDELFLYFSDSPLGSWTPHPCNPIVSDVRTARPAGLPFLAGNTLIRPSQDNSVRYGYAINLNQVDLLSEHAYHETTVARIDPSWLSSVAATHTFNCNEDIEVIDGLRLVKKPTRS